MKTTQNSKKEDEQEMRSNYQFDYSKAKPNRFAGRESSKRVIVMLDQDVSEIFKSSESVNNALRAVISAFPGSSTSEK